MARKKVDDLSKNGATRLMAALAAQEIRDVFDGKGDVELAEKSLYLLLSIIAGAVPNVPTSKAKELAKPAHNSAMVPCPGHVKGNVCEIHAHDWLCGELPCMLSVARHQ